MDLSGKVFGRWTVQRFAGRRQYPGATWARYWKCKCKCGTIREVAGNNLMGGRSRSCGCLNNELAKKRIAARNYRHGLRLNSTKRTQKPLAYIYEAWRGAKSRCYNPNSRQYEIYGARGITMYEPWINDAKAFFDYIYKTLGSRPSRKYSLHRLDPDRGYEPGNLQWATPAIQAAYTRRGYRKYSPEAAKPIEDAAPPL